MNTPTLLAIALAAILHIGFMLLEAVFWSRPLGRKIFGLKPEFAHQSATLAINQGLYNGFLAAGLVFGLLSTQASFNILSFFLICMIIAGIVGALTVSRMILLVQALPAAVALGLLLLSN